MPISPLTPQPPMPAPAPGKAPDADLALMRRKAEELESAFLSVMLGHVRRRMIWNRRSDFGAESSGSSVSGYAA
jgi:hypothetical protein